MDFHVFAAQLFLLVGAHALCDYPLQGDFLAEAKDRHFRLGQQLWKWALPSHAMIHGLFVYLITGSLVLGTIEVVLHTFIDYCKCEKKISFDTDQVLHLACKLLYALTIGYAYTVDHRCVPRLW
jgi:hypothetical protein